MDVSTVVDEIEAAVGTQMRLAGGDAAVEAAGEALLTALRPTLLRGAQHLAEQAAAEVDAQLPDHAANVVIEDGEPVVLVRPHQEAEASFAGDGLEARLTLRLPGELKRILEQAAGEAGDSVNTYVVKSLSRHSRQATAPGRRYRGTIET